MTPPDDLYAAAFALGRSGRFSEALTAIDRALAADPQSAAAHALRGAVQVRLGDAEGALQSTEAALALDPANPEAHAARGDALMRLGRPEEAVGSYATAIAFAPGLAYLHSSRARALLELERFEAARRAAEEALALQPRYAEALTGRGNALLALGQDEAALADFRAALGVDSRYYEAFLGGALALRHLQRYDDALAALDRAEQLRPEDARAAFHRSAVRLMTGDFAAGWRDYAARWRIPDLVEATANFALAVAGRLVQPTSPEDFAGRRVAVFSDQGVGDVIMFLSVLPDLLKVAAEVTCACDRRLVALLSNAFPDVRFLDTRDPTPAGLGQHDMVVAAGDLAAAFRKRPEDFSGAPYLAPRPAVVDAWSERLGPAQGRRRVGIAWRGGATVARRTARSIPLAQMQALLGLEDTEFVSLQYGDVSAELATLDPEARDALRVFPADEIDDFEQLAGLIENLDVVVSVQQSVVHLSGALGKACLVMIPARPEWRYGAAGETMPWYNSVRLFRQDTPADWAPVLARIGEALAATPPRPA